MIHAAAIATVQDCTPNWSWKIKHNATRMITITLSCISFRSLIALFSSNCITFAIDSSVTNNFLPYIKYIQIRPTMITNTVATPVFKIKSTKLNLAALPIIMLGGSPISVAVPPILEAMICVMIYGAGSTFKIFVIARVIGPTSKTVVTLSSIPEHTAVIKIKITMIGHGRPFAIFAALIAMYSKIPEFLITATKSIIPTRIQIVSTSTASIQSSIERMWVRTRQAAPVNEATVLWTFPVMIAPIVHKKMMIAMICCNDITISS